MEITTVYTRRSAEGIRLAALSERKTSRRSRRRRWSSKAPPRPITVEILRAADPSLSVRAAQAKIEELRQTFEPANQRGYRQLVPRLDLTRRPAIASKIARYFAADEQSCEPSATTCGKMSEETDTAGSGAQRSSSRACSRATSRRSSKSSPARISYTRPTNRNCACPLRSVLKVECAACVVAF